jgi:hypothetical protein
MVLGAPSVSPRRCFARCQAFEKRTGMTNRTGKEATMWERGLAPVGFLVLLFTLFLSQFSLPDDAGNARHPQRETTGGGVAPSPLTAAGEDLWFPASGHAERRVAKAKTGLPEGDAAGKALVAGAGVLLYPFEIAASRVLVTIDDAARAVSGHAAFRSRAPPAIAA